MKKCRHKRLILMSAVNVEFTADQEPYEADKIEKAEVEILSIDINLHYCPKCNQVVDISEDGICESY